MRSIFRFSQMTTTEKVIFLSCFAGMFLTYILDLSNFIAKDLSRIVFSIFLAVFIIDWVVILLRHK